MVADEFGRDTFMQGVCDYMDKRYPADLLFPADFGSIPKFQFKNSKDDALMQIADFISGTLLRCFDPRKKDAEAGQYLAVLEKKKLRIDFWPPLAVDGDDGLTFDDSQFDDVIRDYCQRMATEYIFTQMGARDEDVQLQVAVLEFLLHPETSDYVYSDRIVKGLLRQGFLRSSQHSTKLNAHRRRAVSRAIGRLRDKDVIIASSESGYKLPSCKLDLHNFFLSTQSKAAPMTGRVSHARNQIREMSKGALDMLDTPDLIQMRALVESLGTINHPVEAPPSIPRT